MGQALSGGLTQYDVEEVIKSCNGAFSQSEIETLYERFRRLDRQRTGFISAEALMGIPELSINPLAQRLVRTVESANFTEFVRVLAAFSARTPREDKVRFIFDVYDVDGDGVVSREDMSAVLRQLGGASLSESAVQQLIDRAFAEAAKASAGGGGGSGGDGLRPADFAAALRDQDLSGMVVTVPSAF